MNLYILLDDEEPETIADKLMAKIDGWLQESELDIQPVDVRPENSSEWQQGVRFECKRKVGLKQPLEFLFMLAKKIEREFVIGFYDKESGNKEDVCYFGYEEGRPDIDEVGLYLGLKR